MNTDISVDGLKRAISYFYLVAYAPPEEISALKKTSKPLRQALAKQARMTMTKYFAEVTPEVCHRIVAFHQHSRHPDAEMVQKLTAKAKRADSNPEKAGAYQEVMSEIAALPQRAKPDNRLHRKKGCRFCATPCQYGYFTLVSEPHFDLLQKMLEAEVQKPKEAQDVVQVAWNFAASHLVKTQVSRNYIATRAHLGNLAYCLLMLAMAKSRFALPEKQITAFQAANQRAIQP